MGSEMKLAEVCWVLRDAGMRCHGEEVGPTSLGTSIRGHCHRILIGVENQHGEFEAGYPNRPKERARSCALGSCVGVRVDDDDLEETSIWSQFPGEQTHELTGRGSMVSITHGVQS